MRRSILSFVLAGLGPAIRAFQGVPGAQGKAWMPGTRLHKAGHDDLFGGRIGGKLV